MRGSWSETDEVKHISVSLEVSEDLPDLVFRVRRYVASQDSWAPSGFLVTVEMTAHDRANDLGPRRYGAGIVVESSGPVVISEAVLRLSKAAESTYAVLDRNDYGGGEIMCLWPEGDHVSLFQ